MSQEIDQRPSGKSRIRCRVHGLMGPWLAASGGSLAVTTYTSGKLLLFGSFDGRLRFRERHLPRPMGLAVKKNRLVVATKTNILQFQKSHASATRQRTSDAVFTPTRRFVTGKLNTHDLAFGNRGIYFANTRFNCIARVSKKKNFLRVWQPSFLDSVAPKDRCHLNGLGMKKGRPAMATAFCETSRVGGWREEDRFRGGLLIDIPQNQIVARGLCMPHSPRLHDERWWLCNSGHGTLAVLDPKTGECPAVCSLPGFTRGLCFVGHFALVGLSKIRHKHILDAPPVHKRHAQLIAGIALVDLRSGQHTGTLEFVQGGREVFDIAFLPEIRRPNVIVA